MSQKTYEGNDYNKIYQILSTIKNKKLKLNKILIEKHKDMLEKPDFEKDYYSRQTKDFLKMGHDSCRLLKHLSYYDRLYFQNRNNDLMGSVLKYLIETS